MGKRNIIEKGTTQNMEGINREGKWAKRETRREGNRRGKRKLRSGEEKKDDKGENSAIIKVVKFITFFTMFNVENYHIIRHKQFRIKLYIDYALLLFRLK
jgi:hypothetical protein